MRHPDALDVALIAVVFSVLTIVVMLALRAFS